MIIEQCGQKMKLNVYELQLNSYGSGAYLPLVSSRLQLTVRTDANDFLSPSCQTILIVF